MSTQQVDVPQGLGALIDHAREHEAGRKVADGAPVELWDPPFCGMINMHIAADGTWFYKGTPILRPALVRLFASVLRREDDGRFVLVTPVEKVGITVEDAPFLGVELLRGGEGEAQSLKVRTNVGDVVSIDAAHPLRFEVVAENGGLKPYILVRGRLEALLARPLLYDLAGLFSERLVDGRVLTGVWSSGEFFGDCFPAE